MKIERVDHNKAPGYFQIWKLKIRLPWAPRVKFYLRIWKLKIRLPFELGFHLFYDNKSSRRRSGGYHGGTK